MAKLIISEGGRDKIYEIADEEFTVGSGTHADLQVRSQDVSPVHLTVRKGRSGFRLIDMETKAGTVVNGKAVNEHTLSSGDTIELSDVKITYIGKGPARAAGGADKAAPGRGGGGGGARYSRLESRRDLRRAEKTHGNWGNFAIIAGIILGIVLVALLMLKTTDPPNDPIMTEMRGRMSDLERHGVAAYDEAAATVAKMEKTQLSSEQREKLYELKKALEGSKQVLNVAQKSKDAAKAWVDIHNMQLHEPNNTEGLRQRCEAYLADFPDGAKAGDVQEILDWTKKQKEMTPEQRELALVETKVRAHMQKKELQQAMGVVKGVRPEIAAMFPEEVERIRRKVFLKSNKYFRIRKNDVRFYLRDGNWDPAKAREVAEDELFSKLCIESVEEYLAVPDSYDMEINQRAEEELQKLLKEMLAEWKARH